MHVFVIFPSKKLQEIEIFTTFVAECELLYQNLNCMENNPKWQTLRKWLINKYAITLLVFAVIFVFMGEQSIINQLARKIEMRKIRQEICELQVLTAENESVLRSLDNPDSLEHFARETYKMHAPGEVVFVVE